jgi:hypothetical protein
MHNKTVFPVILILSVLVFSCKADGLLGFPAAEGLDVHDVIADPFGYSGEITIRGGVMEKMDPRNNLFHVIDYREYRGCRSVTCAPKWISVVFDQELPKAWDIVEVRGVIEKNALGKGEFVLKAKEIRVKGTVRK